MRSMHLSNVCIDPTIINQNRLICPRRDEYGNNNWRNDLYVCIANRNFFIRVLAKGRVENDEF